MKKKIIIIALLLITAITLVGCEKRNKEAALNFKKEYEALNGKETKSGAKHRNITINENNPYEKVTPSKIVELIDNKETFYLFVGDPLCPWCRSVLEKSIEVANDLKIKKIYYIDIWDEEGNEILRDKYELQKGKPVKIKDGIKEYERLLKEFDSVLRDYTLTDEKGKDIEVGEKRIFAPNYFYIKDGKVVKMSSGRSDKQTDSREELTKEMLEDEEKAFKDFFNN